MYLFTFETLLTLGFDPAGPPSLRYATQAGGRLHPDLVVRVAERMNAAGRRFDDVRPDRGGAAHLYLPPELATIHPGSIGRAIPGGRLFVIDDDGRPIDAIGVTGQLAYEGPNVMMGYATSPADLAGDETPPRLATGDLAMRITDDLFAITGRANRIVKPFGLRINLDDLQELVGRMTGNAVVATGTDASIVLATLGREPIALDGIAHVVGLPRHVPRDPLRGDPAPAERQDGLSPHSRRGDGERGPPPVRGVGPSEGFARSSDWTDAFMPRSAGCRSAWRPCSRTCRPTGATSLSQSSSVACSPDNPPP